MGNMAVVTKYIPLVTEGNGDVLNLTDSVQACLAESGLGNGVVTIFPPSATSGLTTLEYESGCIEDLQRLFDEILPSDKAYAHNLRWGDGNGHSHARAAVLKPSLTVPFCQGIMTLGTWQSIVLVDFDNRSRQRKLVVQIMGE
jgi:secondary thiamine-phosphate synthase enzyme